MNVWLQICHVSCLLLVVISCHSAAAQQGPNAATLSATLTYREYSDPVHSEVLRFERQTAPFSKEPDLGGRTVLRGELNLGTTTQHVAFMWDRDQQRLYLDLNRNRDLTDDAEGRFTSTATGTMPRGWAHQRFQGVRVKLDPSGQQPASLFDLEFYDYGAPQLQITLHSRSAWEGKLSLAGHDWQVGLLQVHMSGEKSIENGYLLLRPWDSRDRPINANDTSLECVSWPKLLFFQGMGYKLAATFLQDTNSNSPACKLEWAAQETKLGALNLTGKFINRLVLHSDSTTVLLCTPAPSVNIPVGTYDYYQLTLKQGDTEAYLSRSATGRIEIAAPKTATLTAGGPLTNSVTVTRRGQLLTLNYQLTGGAGLDYSLTGPRKEPEFAVYRGDKKLADGKFAFG